MLGSSSIWSGLDSIRSELERYFNSIQDLAETIPPRLAVSISSFYALAQACLKALNESRRSDLRAILS